MNSNESTPALDKLSPTSDNSDQENSAENQLEITQTSAYARWFGRLRDRMAKIRIAAYFDKAQAIGELAGDLKPVGDHVIEARFDIGPGYRVYLTREGKSVVLLLVGGDKTTQDRDIKKAKKLARKWRQDHENL